MMRKCSTNMLLALGGHPTAFGYSHLVSFDIYFHPLKYLFIILVRFQPGSKSLISNFLFKASKTYLEVRTISLAFSMAAAVGLSPPSIFAMAVMRSSFCKRRIDVNTLSFLISL